MQEAELQPSLALRHRRAHLLGRERVVAPDVGHHGVVEEQPGLAQHAERRAAVDAVLLRAGVQGAVVRDTVIVDVGGRCLAAGSTAQGPAHTLEGNLLWRCGEGAWIGGAAVARTNLVLDPRGDGIAVDAAGDGLAGGVVLSHNTVVVTPETWDAVWPGEGDWAGWGVRVEEGDALAVAGTFVLANHAIVAPTGRALRVDAGDDGLDGAFIAGNLVTGLVELPPWGGEGPDGCVASGGGVLDVTDVTAPDLYPTPEATLRNAGRAEAEAWVPEVDFNGVARRGDAPDVGAYEANEDDNPGWMPAVAHKVLGVRQQPAEVRSGCGGAEGRAAGLLPVWLLFGLRVTGRRRPPTASGAPPAARRPRAP